MQHETAELDPFAHAPVGLARLGTNGAVQHVNKQLCDMLGYPAKKLTRMLFLDLVHPEDLEADKNKLAYLLRKGNGEISLVKRLLHATGKNVIVHLSIRMVYGRRGESDHFIVALQNLSRTHQRLEQLERRTRHDRLTNILNRAGFTEYVYDAFRTYQRLGTEFALAFLDLDGFKEINDTWGHATGDLVLKGVASRLTKAVGYDGVVARIGGDEFAILLRAIKHKDQLNAMNYRIQAALNAPLYINKRLIAVSASVGFAHCPNDAQSARALLQHADKKMYARKNATSLSSEEVLRPASA